MVAPRVLHDVVVRAVLGTISDREDGVVKNGPARGVSDDALHVVLERVRASADGDGHGLLGDRCLELGDAVARNIRVAQHLDLSGER